MLDTVNSGANRVARVENFEMAHDRNISRVRGVDRNLHEGEWQTKVNFDSRSTIINKAIYRKPRLFGIAYDV